MKIFALIVAASMGLSSAAFVTETTTAPAMHHHPNRPAQTAKTAKKHLKKHTKAAPKAAATPAA